MKIKIGVAHTSRVVEIDSDDIAEVRTAIEEVFAKGQPMLWIEDSDGTQFGIPTRMLAFVEFESPGSRSGVGFAAGS
ncbi:MAG: DUF3107 family protein [bacterium]|nr:DUF3107 family protein [Acidimicrobiia bacterium]MCY4648935.1 DUF3107 family protein [bacterium]